MGRLAEVALRSRTTCQAEQGQRRRSRVPARNCSRVAGLMGSAAGAYTVGGCAMPGDSALGGGELGGNVPDRPAALGEDRDHGLLFGWRELGVGDTVPGERPLDGDVVDVRLGG